jgi:hypothetical protein
MKTNGLLNHWVTAALFFLAASFLSSYALALTPGQAYTVTIEKLTSAGAVTSGSASLFLTATAQADANGKLAFSVAEIPNNSSCNFLVVTISDGSGATVRRSIVPCPDSGKSLPLGVSGVTDKQTGALLAAFASAGTDDPLLAVFGFAIVRSTGMTTNDLTVLANACNQGINAAGGFLSYLSSNGVTAAQLAAYRTNVVSRLADPDIGFSKSFKDSVDVASSSDSTLEAAKRGEASGKLLKMLIQAATTAGIPQDRVLEAFNAMGSVVMPILNTARTAGTLSATSLQTVNSSIGGGMQKLTAERTIEIYAQALATLGGSASDQAVFTSAATTLGDAMTAAFANFDKVFTGTETAAQVQAAQATQNAAMGAAFSAFMTSTAASNSRIATMMSNIETAMGMPGSMTGRSAMFQFYKSDGTSSNWPIMMVIPTDLVSSYIVAGGSLTYTRDTSPIPAAMTWLSVRTDFSTMAPPSYARLFEIQQDIMIVEFTRFAAQSAAGLDMSAQQVLEKNFSTKMASIAGSIGGTTNGTTTISSAVQSALTRLMQSPQI